MAHTAAAAAAASARRVERRLASEGSKSGQACFTAFGLVVAVLGAVCWAVAVRSTWRARAKSSSSLPSALRGDALSPSPWQHSTEEGACGVDALEVCRCLLECEVFGQQPEQCEGRRDEAKLALVEGRIRGNLSSVVHSCRGVACVVTCAKQLGCYNQHLTQLCRHLKAESPRGEQRCDVTCEDDKAAAMSQ